MSEIMLSSREKALARELSRYMDIQNPTRRHDYDVKLARLKSKIYPRKRENLIARIWIALYVKRQIMRALKNAR